MIRAATPRAVFYLRMSTDRQDKSIAEQRHELEKFAKRLGYCVVGEYKDEGISGDATEKRLEFQRMIRDAEERGDFDVILCWDQDRFGRFDSIEAGRWIHPLRSAGVRLETIAQGAIDWTDFAGRLIYQVQQEGKHQFLRDLARNVTRGLLNAAQTGKWVTGRPPYGYDLDAERNVVLGHPEKVRVVQWVFKTYADTDTSLAAVTETLNERGTPGPRGGPWRIQTVQAMLRNPVYCGDFVWNRRHHGKYQGVIGGEIRSHADVARAALEKTDLNWRHLNRTQDHVVVEGAHEAIVRRELFAKVQAKLKERRLRTTPHRGGGSFVLSDLLRCSHCGAKMYGADRASEKQGKRYVYRRYVCASYVQMGKSVCNHHAVIEGPLVEYLVGVVQKWLLNPVNLDRVIERAGQLKKAPKPADDLARLRKRLADLDQQIATGTDRLLKVPDSLVADLAAKIDSLRAERDRLRVEIKAAGKPRKATADEGQASVERLTAAAHRLAERLLQANPAVVREVLRQTIDHVECTFGKQRRGSRIYFPLKGGKVFLKVPDSMSGLVKNNVVRLTTPVISFSAKNGTFSDPVLAS